MIGAFAGEKKSFDKPVLVEFVMGGPMAMGFITKESLWFLSLLIMSRFICLSLITLPERFSYSLQNKSSRWK
jgi:hypothetical protein